MQNVYWDANEFNILNYNIYSAPTVYYRCAAADLCYVNNMSK